MKPMDHLALLINRYPVLEPVKEAIFQAYCLLEKCYEGGGKLLIGGNGGSSADSEHIVGELMKGFCKKRQVPEDFESLLSLAGVGRKTANVVSAVAFGKQAMAVDTHVLRLANRIGFIKSDKPEQVEKKLTEIIPHERLSQAHHLLIHHGRYICTARKPDCAQCPITQYCKFYNEGGL